MRVLCLPVVCQAVGEAASSYYDSSVKQVLVLANPIAGRGRGVQMAREICYRFAERGIEASMELRPIDRPDADESALRQADALVVIGGDGTLRKVVETLIRRRVDPIPPILLVPRGTANLMAQHLGLRFSAPSLVDRVVQMVGDPTVVRLDGAVANGACFLLMASVGFDAAVVHELTQHRRGVIHKYSYIKPALQAVMHYPFPAITVHAEGRRVFGARPGIAVVANVREYGIGLPLVPQADACDGQLDLLVLPCERWEDLPALLLKVAAGEPGQIAGGVVCKARSVRIESAQEVPVQLDGDAAGFTPLDIEVLPVQIPLIVPRGRAKPAMGGMS